jgi:hypothetical protein
MPSRRLVIRTLLVSAVVVAGAFVWYLDAQERRLADDSGLFYTHEESVAYLAFQESAALLVASEAERKAAEGGPDTARWRREAVEARRIAAAASKSKREYERRVAIKRRLRQ